MAKGNRLGKMGWMRDLPDVRDYTARTGAVAGILERSSALRSAAKRAPARVDLRAWCSPVEDQGEVGSCTANAGVGLLEYFERRAFGNHLDASRLFVYKATRNLLGWTGDQGAYLRTTMKALALFGAPPEKHWPYDPKAFDKEPPAFCYAFGQSYRAIQYYRLDPAGTDGPSLLSAVREKLAAGLPSMFGFTVYSCMPGAGEGTGEIPFPGEGDKVEGGHAVVAAGYDDDRRIGGRTGALLIRNSWGEGWGDKGYGWLPYAYLTQGLAVDFWTLVRADFVDTGLFEEAPGAKRGRRTP